MPSIEEIKLALGTMDKSSNASSINENVNPASFSQELFAPIEKLEDHIHDRDTIIENLQEEILELKNQISILEKEKSNILEELKKSGWLENKVTFSSKYKGNMKTILGEVKVVDTKIISLLTTIGRKKQGNQKLTWKGWLTIPENRYLYEINESIAKDVYNATTEYIRKNWEDRKISRGGGKEQESVNYSLTFTGNSDVATRTYDYVSTDFNPDTYNLNLGFTVSYWVRPDEVGNTMFAFGRKHNNDQRFTFGINRKRQGYFAVGGNKLTTSWVNMDTPVEESLLVQDGSYWNLKTDGTWYHFAVTYDDRTDTSSVADRKVYVNGVLRHTGNFNWSATGGSTGGIYFGARNLTDDYNNGWACGLDEVAIYDTAKDADFIESVYSGSTDYDHTNKSGLVGYWRFNEGSGTTVTDHSGNGNHGTFGTISGDTTAHPTWSTDKP
jgi:hypothetical protein